MSKADGVVDSRLEFKDINLGEWDGLFTPDAIKFFVMTIKYEDRSWLIERNYIGNDSDVSCNQWLVLRFIERKTGGMVAWSCTGIKPSDCIEALHQLIDRFAKKRAETVNVCAARIECRA